jgi:hypothetical protein
MVTGAKAPVIVLEPGEAISSDVICRNLEED